MTDIRGNTNDGGAGTGSDGHCCIVSYTLVTQNIDENYSEISWDFGLDYGDPNYWNNFSNLSIAWTVNVGASITGIAGFGAAHGPDTGTYNTTNPGYGGQVHYFWPGTFRIYHDANGHGTVHLAAQMNFDSNAYTSSISTNIALPNIPQDPAVPTGASAARVSDTQATLSWTNHSTADAPYANTRPYRKTDGGGWALLTTLGASATTYTDTTITANHKYHYGVNAVGTNGAEIGTAEAADIWTTPGAPTSCVAAKVGAGDVQVTWVNNVNYTEYTTRIEHSTDGGSTWAEIANVAAGVATYTDPAPSGATTHRYRVRARTSSGTTLNSAYSTSGTVTLLATANPPTTLAPAGVARDAAGAIVFTWAHNPADGTPQTSYRLQYKIDAGAYVTVGPTSSGTSSYTLPAATLTNGHTITWHVATAGQNGTLSAYSADASFTTSAVPTVTIAAPGASYTSSALTASWTYFQAQGSAQATWQADLLSASDAVIETKSGTSESSTPFVTALSDGVTYKMRVAVTSAAGLSSATAVQIFTVAFAPPAATYVAAAYDSPSGAMVLTVTGDGPTGGVTEPITTVDVQRSINGGAWVTIAPGLTLSVVSGVLTVVLLDTAPTIVGLNSYRAIAHSALPSSAASATEDVTTAEPDWAFLSTGPGFAEVARLRAKPEFAGTAGRARKVYHFADRPDPVALTGTARTRDLSVSALLDDESSTPQEFEDMGNAAGPFLWRDPTGRRVFCTLGPVSTKQTHEVEAASVSFTVSAVDHAE